VVVVYSLLKSATTVAYLTFNRQQTVFVHFICLQSSFKMFCCLLSTIFYCDNADAFQKSNLDLVSMWLPYLKELKPLVQILVCKECTDDDGESVL